MSWHQITLPALMVELFDARLLWWTAGEGDHELVSADLSDASEARFLDLSCRGFRFWLLCED